MNSREARTLVLLILLLVVSASGGCAKKEDRTREQLTHRLQTTLTEIVENSASELPGVLLQVSIPEFGIVSAAAGFSNMEAETAMDPAHKFRAGSILKTFVSVVVLQLVEKGHFSLDDPVTGLLPDDAAGTFSHIDQITVRMLLNHTGGVPEWVTEEVVAQIRANPEKSWPDSEKLDIASATGPSFPPGEGWAYSNTDYVLLGLVIQKTTGRSWRAELVDRIIGKLELESTSLPEPGNRSIPADHARGYHLSDGKFIDLTGVDPSMAGASGGHAMVTTASDLIQLLDAVLAGKFFQRPQTLREMLAFFDAPDEHGVPYEYGLGVEKYVLPGGIEMIGHAGGTAGFASLVYYLPGKSMTLAAAINTQDLEGLYMKVLLPVLEILP